RRHSSLLPIQCLARSLNCVVLGPAGCSMNVPVFTVGYNSLGLVAVITPGVLLGPRNQVHARRVSRRRASRVQKMQRDSAARGIKRAKLTDQTGPAARGETRRKHDVPGQPTWPVLK